LNGREKSIAFGRGIDLSSLRSVEMTNWILVLAFYLVLDAWNLFAKNGNATSDYLLAMTDERVLTLLCWKMH
jgi:hypothetical protein